MSNECSVQEDRCVFNSAQDPVISLILTDHRLAHQDEAFHVSPVRGIPAGYDQADRVDTRFAVDMDGVLLCRACTIPKRPFTRSDITRRGVGKCDRERTFPACHIRLKAGPDRFGRWQDPDVAGTLCRVAYIATADRQ